ncbi:hypothetical protein ABIA14_002439 [Sinorhizobium fredii]
MLQHQGKLSMRQQIVRNAAEEQLQEIAVFVCAHQQAGRFRGRPEVEDRFSDGAAVRAFRYDFTIKAELVQQLTGRELVTAVRFVIDAEHRDAIGRPSQRRAATTAR